MKRIILSVSCLLVLLSGNGSAAADGPGESILTLPQAVQIAIENSPVFLRSIEREKQAEYAARSAKADFFPNLSADYSLTALKEDPYMITAGRKVQVAHTTQYQWGISLVQPLFTGFAISSRYEMEKLGIAIKAEEKQQSALDVTKGVKSAYYHVLLARKIWEVADEAVGTLAAHEKVAQMFFDHGIIRRNDLLRARVALSNAVQDRERASANVGIAVADLNRWLSRDINTDTRIVDIDRVQPVHYSLDVLIEKGLRTRPQLQAMELVKETLAHAVTLAKSTYYPTVSVVGSYSQNGDSPIADHNAFENDHNAALTLQATWTVFDWGKTRSEVRKAKSEERAFDESIREVQDLIRLEIKSAHLNLGVAENNIETARVAFSQAEENLRITRLGYQQEVTTSTEVLDAQTDLTRAKTNYYQALYGYLDALAALEHAIGQGMGPPDSNQNS